MNNNFLPYQLKKTNDTNEALATQLAQIASNVKIFGAKGDGITDDTTAIQSAIDTTNASGGGVVYFPPGVYIVAGIKIYSKIHLKGSGLESTVLKLKDNANQDVIFSNNVYTLSGSGSLNGENNFGIYDLTIDGNRANNTIGGHGINLYGYDYIIRSVRIRECSRKGFLSEWGAGGLPTPNGNMEALIEDLKVSKCGVEGIDFAGPHDSQFVNVVVNNCNQQAWGASGIYTRGNGMAVFTNCHVWGVEHANAFKLESNTHLSNCQGEGAQVNVLILSNDCNIQGGNYYGFNTGDIGFRLGSSTQAVSGIMINTKVLNCQGGVIDLLNESVGSYKILAYSSTAFATTNGLLGTLNATSALDLMSHAPNGGKVVQLPSGSLFQFQGTGGYNDGHLILGTYHIWVDSTGKARIKNGSPISDTDGATIGSQV